MKHLKDIVLESLLDDEDEIMNDAYSSAVLTALFSDDEKVREAAMSGLKKKVESYNPKRHKSTNTAKNADFLISFADTWLENSGRTGINHIIITKRIGSDWWTIQFCSHEEFFTKRAMTWIDSWANTRSNLNPKQFLYSVPDDMVGELTNLLMNGRKKLGK